METKSANSRTQADTDAYNNQVNEMNASVNAYNAANAQMNTNKTQVLNEWDKTEKSFADTHMPHCI